MLNIPVAGGKLEIQAKMLADMSPARSQNTGRCISCHQESYGSMEAKKLLEAIGM